MNSCPNCDGELECGWCGEPVPSTVFGTPGCAGGVCAERAEAELKKTREELEAAKVSIEATQEYYGKLYYEHEKLKREHDELLVAAEKVVTAGMVYTSILRPESASLTALIAAGNELSKRACEARAFLRETNS